MDIVHLIDVVILKQKTSIVSLCCDNVGSNELYSCQRRIGGHDAVKAPRPVLLADAVKFHHIPL